MSVDLIIHQAGLAQVSLRNYHWVVTSDGTVSQYSTRMGAMRVFWVNVLTWGVMPVSHGVVNGAQRIIPEIEELIDEVNALHISASPPPLPDFGRARWPATLHRLVDRPVDDKRYPRSYHRRRRER